MTLNANALQLISIVDRLTNAKQIRLSDLEKILGFHVPFDPGRYDYKSCYFGASNDPSKVIESIELYSVKVKGENPPPESSFIDMKMNPLTCIRFEHIPRDWGTNEEIYPPPLGVMGPNAAEIIAQRAHDRQVNYGKVYILHRGLDTECAITVEIKGILVVDDAA